MGKKEELQSKISGLQNELNTTSDANRKRELQQEIDQLKQQQSQA